MKFELLVDLNFLTIISDPCDLALCAPHAYCHARGHSAVCRCEEGYIGDPIDRGCEPGKNLYSFYYKFVINLPFFCHFLCII